MYRLLPLVSLLSLAQGCLLFIRVEDGNGDLVEEVRDVDSFSGVSSEGSLTVEIVAGETPSLTVLCDSNLLEFIDTDVEDGILEISERWSLFPSDGCVVHVVAVGLDHVALSGSGFVRVDGPVEAGRFEIDSSGSGEVDVETLAATSVVVLLSGSGGVVVADGGAGTLDATVSGSGDVDTVGLEAEDATAIVSGSGRIELTATASVDAIVDGSGAIVVHGDPAGRDVSGTGSGTVTFE